MSSEVSVECPPRYREIGCDGDLGRGDLSDKYAKDNSTYLDATQHALKYSCSSR